MAKILFLAQFAPTNGEFIQTSTPEEEFYAQTYHIPIYNFLVIIDLASEIVKFLYNLFANIMELHILELLQTFEL